ncbi:MAG: hypothetical protein JXA52_02295, partial [Planctomycetes bacterium]|nr:hypothetical protein [Planctomycetota bacterium]
MATGRGKLWLFAVIFLSIPGLIQSGCAAEVKEPTTDYFNQDPEMSDYLFAHGMQLPLQNREKVFFANDNNANFTASENVEDFAVEDGKIVFTLTDKKAVLGWGNYLGGQPVAEIVDTFPCLNHVHVRARQVAGESKWTARFWLDGVAQDNTQTATLAGDWQELVFDKLQCGNANPDGLDLVIEGKPGDRIELEWLKLKQPVYEGYVRTEVEIPEGKIWRAVADVQYANQGSWYNKEEIASRFYINGELVKRRGAKNLLHLDPVEIAPYLHAGKNCFAFYGFRINYTPPLYVQARVIMESGEIIEIGSGPEWKYSLDETPGWNQVGFDDSEWKQVAGANPPAIQTRNWARQIGIPAYTGLLVIKNPKRKDLFYPDNDEMLVDVYVPRGLKSRRPTLTYYFAKADREGLSVHQDKAAVTVFAEEDDSLIYRLNLGRQERGIYTLALKLTGNDNVEIAKRHREPLMVLHKITSETIAGSDYREGLDLELEDTVNFDDPEDPHPSVEAIMPVPQIGPVAERVMTPKIVKKEGLSYREVTSDRRGSGFSYRIEFQHPGSFYYLELAYPDDAKRIIEVVISSKAEGVWTNSQSGVGAETGGKFLLTDGMKTLRWLHIADPGPHSIDILNALNGEPAAAKSLKIYRVKGDLPAVAGGMERQYGIHTERCFPTSGIGMNFGSGTSNSGRLISEADQKQSMMQSTIKDLQWIEETGNNYVQYSKFCGQNTHIIACYQYNQINNPFIPMPMVEDSRILPCMKTILAN